MDSINELIKNVTVDGFRDYLRYCDTNDIDACAQCPFKKECSLLTVYGEAYGEQTSCIEKVEIIIDWRKKENKK